MLIYRFKITSEEHEEFLREITIQPAHTFLDFHTILLDAAELIPCDQASFFLTDKKYKKGREISLKPVSKVVKRYDPEMDEMVAITVSSRLMKDTRIKDAIEDPHQRLIYEYNGKSYFSFLVELMKILQTEDLYYASCTRRVGELPLKKELFAEDNIETRVEEELRRQGMEDGLEIHMTRLDAVREDEEAIADIEQNLEHILFEPAEKARTAAIPSTESKSPGVSQDRDDKHTKSDLEINDDQPIEDDEEEQSDQDGGDFFVDDPDHQMEHLEDYDDIEHLEIRYSRLNEDPEDD